MTLDLTAALAVALVVVAWRFGRRRSRNVLGPLPSVGDAPPDAEPIGSPQLNDNGLVTYSLDLPESDEVRRTSPTGRRQEAE